MIRYALKCADGHRFESWFQSADAFDTLAARGMVSCAVCGGADVSKAMMAPRVAGDAPVPVLAPDPAKPPAAAKPAGPLTGSPHPAEQMLRALKDHIAKSSTYVGGRFAAEARAMHLGDAPEKPIHGEANAEEARALIEDGVPILPLPVLPKDRAN
jgi:hypothetical protein